jgi:hypothetical protein
MEGLDLDRLWAIDEISEVVSQVWRDWTVISFGLSIVK